MKNLLTNETVVVENGKVTVVGSCYTKKTEKLAELGFSYTKSKGLTFPDCFNVEVTENNSAQVLYECFTIYSEIVRILYQTTGGFESEMFGLFLFGIFKVLFDEYYHSAKVTEWIRGFVKKCIKFTLQMTRDESVGIQNINRYYSLYITKLLNDILTKYDYRAYLYYLGSDGVCSCRMSTGQFLVTKALWNLSNEFCDISEIVDKVIYSMKLLRQYSTDSEYSEYRKNLQKMEMTACYKEISECIDSPYWIMSY